MSWNVRSLRKKLLHNYQLFSIYNCNAMSYGVLIVFSVIKTFDICYLFFCLSRLHTHTYTHTHTRARAHTHKHTHTHTHTLTHTISLHLSRCSLSLQSVSGYLPAYPSVCLSACPPICLFLSTCDVVCEVADVPSMGFFQPTKLFLQAAVFFCQFSVVFLKRPLLSLDNGQARHQLIHRHTGRDRVVSLDTVSDAGVSQKVTGDEAGVVSPQHGRRQSQEKAAIVISSGGLSLSCRSLQRKTS